MLTWLMGYDSAGSVERLSALKLPCCCLHTDWHTKKDSGNETEGKREGRTWKYEPFQTFTGNLKKTKKQKLDLWPCDLLLPYNVFERTASHHTWYKISISTAQSRFTSAAAQINCYLRSMRKRVKFQQSNLIWGCNQVWCSIVHCKDVAWGT